MIVCIPFVHAGPGQANSDANHGEIFNPFDSEYHVSPLNLNEKNVGTGTEYMANIAVPTRANLRSPYQPEQ